MKIRINYTPLLLKNTLTVPSFDADSIVASSLKEKEYYYTAQLCFTSGYTNYHQESTTLSLEN